MIQYVTECDICDGENDHSIPLKYCESCDCEMCLDCWLDSGDREEVDEGGVLSNLDSKMVQDIKLKGYCRPCTKQALRHYLGIKIFLYPYLNKYNNGSFYFVRFDRIFRRSHPTKIYA